MFNHESSFLTYSNTDTGNHGLLGFFRHETWVQLHKVRVFVEVAERVRDIGVRVDLLELLVRLEAEVFAELVEAGDIPLATLEDAEDLDRLHGLRHVSSSEGTSTVFNGRCDAVHELVIVEETVGTPLEFPECALRWLIRYLESAL